MHFDYTAVGGCNLNLSELEIEVLLVAAIFERKIQLL